MHAISALRHARLMNCVFLLRKGPSTQAGSIDAVESRRQVDATTAWRVRDWRLLRVKRRFVIHEHNHGFEREG